MLLAPSRDAAFAVPGELANQVAWGLGGLGLIGVVVDTFAALGQRAGVQRLLAYIAVSHAGFMLLALAGHANLSYDLMCHAVPATLSLAVRRDILQWESQVGFVGHRRRYAVRPWFGRNAWSLTGCPLLEHVHVNRGNP